MVAAAFVGSPLPPCPSAQLRVRNAPRRGVLVCKQTLESWATERGIKWEGLELHNFKGDGGRGVRAKVAIDPKKTSMTVPASTVLEVDNIRRRKAPEALVTDKAAWRVAPWWAQLAVLLLEEKRLGEESLLCDWILELPQSFDHILRWDKKERKALGYTALVDKAAEEDDILRALHRGLVSPSGTTYSEFCWAVDCIRSRAFSGPAELGSFGERVRIFLFIWLVIPVFVVSGLGTVEQALNGAAAALVSILAYDIIYPKVMQSMQDKAPTRYVLCPFVDYANHKSGTASSISYEFFYDAFTLRTGPFEPKDQVYISYGERSNDQLLLYYGFVEQDNPNEIYVFAQNFRELVRKHPECFSKYSARVNEMYNDGFLDREIVYSARDLVVSKGQSFDLATLECARMLVVDDADYQKFKKTNQFRELWRPEIENRATELLRAIVTDETAMNDKEPADDVLLSSPRAREAFDDREILAARFRREKRKFKQEVLHSLQVKP